MIIWHCLYSIGHDITWGTIPDGTMWLWAEAITTIDDNAI